MMMLLFELANFAAASLTPNLIGGDVVNRRLWPEVIYIETQNNAECSAVVVGDYAILTAAHCVPHDGIHIHNALPQDHEFTAVCDIPPEYFTNNFDFDIAICKTEQKLRIKPARVAKRELELNEIVTLTGYGCTNADGTGNNNGTLKAGHAEVVYTPNEVDTYFITQGSAVLCYGDSGGPAYANIDPAHEKHVVFGINTRTNFQSVSVFSAVYSDGIRAFLKAWAKRNNVTICGINKRC